MKEFVFNYNGKTYKFYFDGKKAVFNYKNYNHIIRGHDLNEIIENIKNLLEVVR